MRKLFLLIPGLGFLFLAVFANAVGLDHDTRWGTSRYAALFIGLLLISLVFVSPKRIIAFFQNPLIQKMTDAVKTGWHALSNNTILSILFFIIILSAIGVYFTWYSSLGMFPKFRADFNPYPALADAMLHGEVSLPEKPDPRLADIKDPWNDIEARSKIPYTFDLSYYQGNYYVYWGPVPALVYAAYQLIFGVRAPEPFGMLFFSIGLAALLAILFFLAKRWSFRRMPGLSIALFVLAAMVNLPQILLVSKSNIYETAIIAGQFFLFLGLVGWFAYLHTRKPLWLVITGLGYALAVGARYNLALCVGVFILFAFFDFWRQSHQVREFLRWSALLLAPLVIMAVGLAWYNAARFGNPLQTGYSYQLPKPGMSYQDYYQHAYSAEYVPSNIYAYLLYPYHVRASFPFIIANPVEQSQFPVWAKMPPLKDYDEVMYGGLFVMPIFWLAILLLPARLVTLSRGKLQSTERPRYAAEFMLMSFLAGLAMVAFLMFFYFSGMRFIADFAPLWITALAFAAWSMDDRLANLPHRSALALRVVFWLIFFLLVWMTVIVGFLAAFDIPPQLFRLLNPGQYVFIRDFLNGIYHSIETFYQGSSLVAAFLRSIFQR